MRLAVELFANSVWEVLAVGSVFLWLWPRQRNFTDRREQLTALVILVVILYPVVSVSDDLWSMQNPTEANTCSAATSGLDINTRSARPLPYYR